MALVTYSFGSDTNKKKPMPHPDPWGRDGTDLSYQLVENVVLQVTNADKNNRRAWSMPWTLIRANGILRLTGEN